MDFDGITGVYGARVQDDSHDAGLPDLCTSGAARDAGFHQAGMKRVHLRARFAQAGDLDDGAGTKRKPSSQGKPEQVDAGRGNVFAHLSGADGDASRGEFGEEFGVQQMDLAEVRRGGVFAHAVEMLGGGTGVRVAVNAVVGDEADSGFDLLAEAVDSASRDG